MNKVKETNQINRESHPAPSEKKMSRRELLEHLSPLGRVELDAARCTACGLCAAECPTGALVISPDEKTDSFKLSFKHNLCLACMECVKICPEKCLRVERILKIDKMGDETALFKVDIVRCAVCGNPVGPRTMINKIQASLTAAGQAFDAQSLLCPECKLKAKFGQPGN